MRWKGDHRTYLVTVCVDELSCGLNVMMFVQSQDEEGPPDKEADAEGAAGP